MVIRTAIESDAEDAAAILKAADLTTYTGSMVLCMDRDKVGFILSFQRAYIGPL
jgi:hypothetical protein